MTSKGKLYDLEQAHGSYFPFDVDVDIIDKSRRELKAIMKKWKLGDSLVKVEDWYTKWFGEEDDEE